MKRVERLKKSALESCKHRGHSMSKFKRGIYWSNVHFSKCKLCSMQVAVDPHPAPNGIDIGGEAVALDCKGKANE